MTDVSDTPKTRSVLRVFLTGASSGIGAALARHYAREGAIIGLVARRAEVLATLADELKTLGGDAAVYVLDVTDAAALDAAAQDFVARFGAPVQVELLQRQQILYDRDSTGGEFLHRYTWPFSEGRFFFELTERRHGYAQYGAVNAAVRLSAMQYR